MSSLLSQTVAVLTGCTRTPQPDPPRAVAGCEQLPTDRFIEIGGLGLRYAERGQGNPPVVLLHGNGAMIEEFAINGVLVAWCMDRAVVLRHRVT